MNPQDAKMKSLDDIIGLMDMQMAGQAKARKQPPIQPPMAAPAAMPPEVQPPMAPPADSGDPEMDRALMEMYSKPEEEEDLRVLPPEPVS